MAREVTYPLEIDIDNNSSGERHSLARGHGEPASPTMEPHSAQNIQDSHRGSVVDQVTSELRRQIIAGTVAPGQILSARAIAHQLGISFTPVREALHILAAGRMVTIRTRRGVEVTPLNPRELRELMTLRRRIEPNLCIRASPEVPTFLQQQIATTTPRPAGVSETREVRTQWYTELIGPSLSNVERSVVLCLRRHTMRYLYRSYLRHDSSCDNAHTERFQRDIIHTFRTHDIDQTRTLIIRMLERHETQGTLSFEE
jgi:DNA-binding GntR family transcriptional regulator